MSEPREWDPLMGLDHDEARDAEAARSEWQIRVEGDIVARPTGLAGVLRAFRFQLDNDFPQAQIWERREFGAWTRLERLEATLRRHAGVRT